MAQNSKRGFGAMDEQQQNEISRKGGESSGDDRGNQNSGRGRELASDQETKQRVSREGGKASHEKGTGHKWNSEEVKEAGRKGGEKSGGGR